MTQYRIEKDSMGEIQVPIEAMWGAQTQRSLLNFNIGNETMPTPLIFGIALVKKAAAISNESCEKLDTEKSHEIQVAVNEILTGNYQKEFPLSIWQTGSGTQTNMNVNEVISNLVARNTQNKCQVHPNDDVNMSQSTNDVFPTAIHVAGTIEITKKLLPVMKNLSNTLKKLEVENEGIIKIGRTHLQDATPLLFSQEISGWRSMIEQSFQMIQDTLPYLYELPIGGTAVGTGLNATQKYSSLAVKALGELTAIPFTESKNKFHALTSKDAVVFTHGALKALATNLMKIANDIRWMASGPRSGFGEISIPANEPGSSIMPGKVNPTQCEAMTMIVTQVMGNDAAIGFAASQGNFELNVFMPSIAYQFLQSIQLLTEGMRSFEEHCVVGIKANQKKMCQYVEESLMLVTALNSHIGYDHAAQIAKQAFQKDQTLEEAALESGYVTKEQFQEWVKPEKMIGE